MDEHPAENETKLGFCLMRLPHHGMELDLEQSIKLIDRFIEDGFTYFDTAQMYLGSEELVGKAIVSRYPREAYTLASKLYAPLTLIPRDAREQFYTSMKRTGLDCFDQYLLHAVTDRNYWQYETMHLWEFMRNMKKTGFIRSFGFSYNGSPKLLNKLFILHKDVDFIQLRLNYAEWESPDVQARANYELARKHGKPIVAMAPCAGGKLANPPEEVLSLFKSYAPDASAASWAVRFAASLEGVTTVISRMSSIEQIEDNMSYMRDFKPFNSEEWDIIREAQRIMAEKEGPGRKGGR